MKWFFLDWNSAKSTGQNPMINNFIVLALILKFQVLLNNVYMELAFACI